MRRRSKATFGSASLSLQEWSKVIAAGMLVFCVAELEKWILRRNGFAARLSRH